MDPLTSGSPGAGARASDSLYPADRALREVLRLEEALAAASKGISDRIAARASAAAVQTDSDPVIAGNADGGASAVEIADLPSTSGDRQTDTLQAPREVARLEDVLTVAPTRDGKAADVDPSASLVPQVQETDVEAVAVPTQEIEPAPSADAAPPAALQVDEQAAEPIYVAAHALREAFWFEQASAFRSSPDDQPTTGQAPRSAEPEPDSLSRSDDTIKVTVEAGSSPSLDALPTAQPRSNWVGAVCVLALVALVSLLLGRKSRAAS